MPMFDNPNKELQRLQEQLLAEEEEELDELVEEFGEEDYREFFEGDYEEEYTQEPYYRSNSNSDRKRSLFDEIEDAFTEDEEDGEPFALFVEEKRGLFGRKKKNAKKKGGTRGLKVTLLLEVIAILCILIWWVVMKL